MLKAKTPKGKCRCICKGDNHGITMRNKSVYKHIDTIHAIINNNMPEAKVASNQIQVNNSKNSFNLKEKLQEFVEDPIARSTMRYGVLAAVTVAAPHALPIVLKAETFVTYGQTAFKLIKSENAWKKGDISKKTMFETSASNMINLTASPSVEKESNNLGNIIGNDAGSKNTGIYKLIIQGTYTFVLDPILSNSVAHGVDLLA